MQLLKITHILDDLPKTSDLSGIREFKPWPLCRNSSKAIDKRTQGTSLKSIIHRYFGHNLVKHACWARGLLPALHKTSDLNRIREIFIRFDEYDQKSKDISLV